MATVLDRTVQSLADATGIIVDRTVTPEKIIGQAWIISKSRMVVLASSVANYADAPWALLVKFPYPDLVFSVKAISLHPEFNRRASREHYLAQANELLPQTPIMENDIATITIEAEIPDLQPDRVQELNRALSLPLNISAQDLSGVMRAGDTGNILQKAITSQRNGVLNFYDERKVPFCRVLIRGGRIVKAAFQNLQNEYAICELMWRKPGGNFVLQSSENFSWGAIPDIAMPTDQLANEAARRNNDLPRMLDALGGPNVRYVKTRPQMDLNLINQDKRWVVERLWPVLDGGMPLHKLSERLAIDTYTALQALWEMKHHGFIAMANTEQYHRSGQLGAALTPGHDVDVKFWDNLQGFYLDDLSNLPVTIQGNYFGSTHLLQTGTLLHTMPIQNKYGAIVLKDGRLIGLHNGRFTAPMQNPPPFPLSQMSWIGSLSDMSAKRLRAATTEVDSEGLEDLAASGARTMTGLKSRSLAAQEASGGQGVVQQDLPIPPAVVSNEPELLQKFTKVQMGAGGGAIGLLLGMIIACSTMAPKPAVAPPPSTPVNTASSSSSTGTGTDQPKVPPSGPAFDALLKLADFKSVAFPGFQFTDTSKETGKNQSFGMESERTNQKIYFVVWPNARNPVDTVETNAAVQPPYVPLKKWEAGVTGGTRDIAKGTSPVHDFYWKAVRCLNAEDKITVALVGAFPASDPSQNILVIAVPYKGEGDIDFKTTVSVIERMFNEGGGSAQSSGTNTSSTAAGAASAEDVQAYRQKVGDLIKTGFKAPADSDRANKCVVNFEIDPTGNVSSLELKSSSSMDDVDKAVQKAISSKVPYPAPPGTKSGKVPVQVTFDGGEFSFDEP